MLLESMLDNADDDQIDNNNRAIKTNHHLSNKAPSNTDSNGVFLLLNANEHLTVSQHYHYIIQIHLSNSISLARLTMNLDFIRQLKCSSQDPSVKCVSIIGNTGDGKSSYIKSSLFQW